MGRSDARGLSPRLARDPRFLEGLVLNDRVGNGFEELTNLVQDRRKRLGIWETGPSKEARPQSLTLRVLAKGRAKNLRNLLEPPAPILERGLHGRGSSQALS
jgi:hypothetical protein